VKTCYIKAKSHCIYITELIYYTKKMCSKTSNLGSNKVNDRSYISINVIEAHVASVIHPK